MRHHWPEGAGSVRRHCFLGSLVRACWLYRPGFRKIAGQEQLFFRVLQQ